MTGLVNATSIDPKVFEAVSNSLFPAELDLPIANLGLGLLKVVSKILKCDLFIIFTPGVR